MFSNANAKGTGSELSDGSSSSGPVGVWRGSVFRSTVALGIVAAQAGAGVQKSLPWRAPVVMATLTIRPMSSGAAAAQKPDSGHWRVCGVGAALPCYERTCHL